MRSEGDTWDITTSVGSTALFVATARALEAQKPDPLAVDPYAEVFCRAVGGHAADVLDGKEPDHELKTPDWGEHFVNFQGARTRYFDEYFRRAADAGVRQVVILAAGLDSRAYRLDWPAGTTIFEVDQPQVLALKQDRLGGVVPTCTRIVVPANLADDWPAAVVAQGFRPDAPTAWLAEGLLPYLDEALVRRLLARVDKLSAPGSTLLTDVIGKTLLEAPQLRPMLDFVRGLGAPWTFGTDEPESLLEPLGWKVTAHDLGAFAAEVGRWPWPVIPRSVPGLPRSFLVEATRP